MEHHGSSWNSELRIECREEREEREERKETEKEEERNTKLPPIKICCLKTYPKLYNICNT